MRCLANRIWPRWGVVLLSLSLVSCYVAYQTRVASSQQSLSDLGAVIGGTKSSVLSVDSSYIVEQDKVTSSTQTVFGGTKAASIDFATATGDQPSQAPRAAEEPFVDAVLIDKNLHYTLRIPTNDHYAQAFRQYVEALPPAANSGPSSSPIASSHIGHDRLVGRIEKVVDC